VEVYRVVIFLTNLLLAPYISKDYNPVTFLIPRTDKNTIHYRNCALCRAPTAHGKGTKTHGTAFAVRLFPKRMTKGAQLIFTR
jgi:hypothetical protein